MSLSVKLLQDNIHGCCRASLADGRKSGSIVRTQRRKSTNRALSLNY